MGDNTDADVKKVAAAAISAAKEDTKAATAISAAKEDTKASTNEDTKADAKEDTNDTNDTNDTKEDTNDANDANDATDANDANDTTDANDANDATDADDTTDAKDGDVEKKPNKRSVGQQERRERERQAKDTNNRNIVKEKLLGNIKKSQFVGNAINPKMQGLHGFFETFLKNTNKELKEGEKEKKTDILKLFGDTNLLASINKLDISIKKNFKTFIFNSMNDISEFFFDKNDQTETDEYDKTYFKDFFIGIKDENLDLNKKYTLFYNKKTENLELISDGEKGFKISLEPGEENIYKINVGDFLSDYEADKEAGPDKDTKEADEEVFDEQDIGDTIGDIKEKVEKNEKLDKNNIDISKKTQEIRNIKDESNLKLEEVEENLTLINKKFDAEIQSINGDLNEKYKEIQTKMKEINESEDGPKKKELETNLLRLEEEKEKLIKDKEEKIEEKNKEIAPIEKEKNRIIKDRREKIEEPGNEKKELLLENQSLRKHIENLEKKNDPDLPDDLKDISEKIEGIKKKEKKQEEEKKE